WTKERWRALMLAVSAMALGFFLTTPFAVFDFANFWEGLRWQIFSYSVEGHSGQEGDSLRWYLTYLWGSEGWIALLGALGILWMARALSFKYLTLISFPVAYFILVSQMVTRNERTIMLIIPFLNLCAATLLVDLYQQFVSAFSFRRAIILGALSLIVLPSLCISIASTERLLTIDSRETARVWIEQNLPHGARIAIEPYSPYVDRDHFVVEAVGGMIAHPRDWYVQNGFEYLVFSYGSYGRFFESRTQYADLAAQYEALWARYPEVKRFNDGGFEVRIYKTNITALPTRRVGARLGVYEGWLEFVGYDHPASVLPGETLNVVLYWRALKVRRESFQLTARLLDRADREIAQSSGELITKPEEITRVVWSIRVPQDATPGFYRIQLDVDAPSVGRIPVLNRFREPIAEKTFIGPSKVAPMPPTQDELNAARCADARFGDAINLDAYSIQRQNDAIRVVLYWRSLKPTRDYTVFVHLLDAHGNLRAQLDTQPRGGAYPISIWDAGEIVRDDYALALPRDLAPGEYRLAIGLYEYPSLIRARVQRGDKEVGDYFLLDEIIRVIP
ncbi:MAG: hypothetical protein L0Y55_10195, partial [Anaerolineales bacterium]|nr:hypothetical protein [Anaerolineales bacterium]